MRGAAIRSEKYSRIYGPSCPRLASNISNDRQECKSESKELKEETLVEQRPLITRRVAGLYISDHAAWRRERTNAFTTQCRALLKAPSGYLFSLSFVSVHSPPFPPSRFSLASLPSTTRPSSGVARFSPLREDQL